MSARLLLAAFLSLAIAGCERAPPPVSVAPGNGTISTAPTIDIDAEAARLQASLAREVPGMVTDTPDSEHRWTALAQAAMAAGGHPVTRPQLLVVVDRNPAIQQMRIVLALPSAPWRSLGGSKVSTGQEGRHGYFITPTGVFPHTDAILDWRAEGTFNENHIRGLGAKGMRVWDFGWQSAERGWQADGGMADIRLLVHATDPDYLEQRIGKPASKGCVRVPAVVNIFLDRHGILDADYEAAAKADPRYAAVLRPDRTPTPLAGDMLVIVDSAGAAF
jgi:hypothetical protein